ncbi:MucR family transcriptional regulator [Labrys sp. KB_33_2]|uniref:MucR family transcriptional regulator n=1 Tax=Labrys sp. KB_33_2 TaxID=3237479 RepID=UPI003F939609
MCFFGPTWQNAAFVKRNSGIISDMQEAHNNLIDITVDIVAAYVANNSIPTDGLPSFISMVHDSLSKLREQPVVEEATPLRPAVPVRKSVTPDFIVCLEDGQKFKSLRRHLRSKYNMSPEEYRSKWGLADDYPMVAPNYAAERSRLAKAAGLGSLRWGRSTPPAKTAKAG